jgi:spermidine synthase
LLIPSLLPVLELGRAWLGEGFGFEFYRFLASALLLTVPTTLMGATFPVLLRGLLNRPEEFGLRAGLLYGINALGATTGALLSGLVLIPALGFRATIWSAAGVNFLILALVAGLPALRGLGAAVPKPARVLEAASRPGWRYAVLLAGYGLSGLCAMVYQVGWARTLSLSLSNTTYALALILAAYIGGLALGGLAMAPWADRLRRPLVWAAGLELVIGLSALGVVPWFEWVTARMFYWSPLIQDRFWVTQALRFAAAFALILVPTLAMGALFPVAIKIAGSERGGVGEPAGQVYAANTLGAILGAFLAGHVLIRGLGLETTLLAATGASVAIGIGWLLVARAGRFARAATAAALAAGAIAAISVVPRWDPVVMSSGSYLYGDQMEEQFRAGLSLSAVLNTIQVLYYREGEEASVAVLEFRTTGDRGLRINGKSDASNSKDMPTQVLIAELPLLLHPHPKKVMILGLASGVSAGSALRHPVERVDCVEISPEVVEASRFFQSVSRLDYQDPRFHLILDDGRNYLALTKTRYDVITIEATNPWISGIGQLYTREFFQLLADHLEPDGLALIFIPVYDLDPERLRMVLRTFGSVFPYPALWESIPGADYLVAGSKQPWQVDFRRWQERAAAPAIAADLARAKVRGDDFFARFVLGPRRYHEAAGSGPLHSDDRSQLEFILPKVMQTPSWPRTEGILEEIFSSHEPATVILTGVPAEEQARLEEFDRTRSLYQNALLATHEESAQPANLGMDILVWRQVLAACQGSYPAPWAAMQLAPLLTLQAKMLLEQGERAGALAEAEEAYEIDPQNLQAGELMMNYYQDQREATQTRTWAQRLLARAARHPNALAALGDLAVQASRLPEAERWYRLSLEAMPDYFEARWNLALVLSLEKKLGEAEHELRALEKSRPDDVDTLLLLGEVLQEQGLKEEGNRYLQKARKLAPNHPYFSRSAGVQP